MDTYIKLIVSFFTLLLVTRLLGRKQMGQLTYFNYITGITLGTLAASVILDNRIPLVRGLIALGMWSGLTYLLGYLTLKSRKLRLVFDGEPAILIKKGRIQEKVLLRTRMTMDDVKMMLREKEIFSVKEVDFAVLEPNGKISVFKQMGDRPAVKKDIAVQPLSASKYMPTQIIIDGKGIQKNLDELGLTQAWLQGEVKKAEGADANVKDLFYAEIQSDGSLYTERYANS